MNNDFRVNSQQPSFSKEQLAKKEEKAEVRKSGITYTQFKNQIKAEWTRTISPIKNLATKFFQKTPEEESEEFSSSRYSFSDSESSEEKVNHVAVKNRIKPFDKPPNKPLPPLPSNEEVSENDEYEFELTEPESEEMVFDVAEKVYIEPSVKELNPDAVKLNEERRKSRIELENRDLENDPKRGRKSDIEHQARAAESIMNIINQNKKLRFQEKPGEIVFKTVSGASKGKTEASKETAEKLLEQTKHLFETIFPKGLKTPNKGSIDEKRHETFMKLLDGLDKSTWFQNTLNNFPELKSEFITLKSNIYFRFTG